MYKWILGIGALILTRKIGLAFLGFAIGSLIDQYQQGSRAAQGSNGAGKHQDPFDFYRRQSSVYDFPTMLMALSAAVMNADGKVLRIELDYVKNFFSAQFGKQFNATHLQTLKQFLDAPSIPLQEICHDIRNRLTQEEINPLENFEQAASELLPYDEDDNENAEQEDEGKQVVIRSKYRARRRLWKTHLKSYFQQQMENVKPIVPSVFTKAWIPAITNLSSDEEDHSSSDDDDVDFEEDIPVCEDDLLIY